jgi:hypothetical protein
VEPLTKFIVLQLVRCYVSFMEREDGFPKMRKVGKSERSGKRVVRGIQSVGGEIKVSSRLAKNVIIYPRLSIPFVSVRV